MRALVCIAFSALSASLGARLSKHEANRTEKALVDGIYTFGSPPGAKPSLRNRAKGSGGCFPGLRVVSTEGLKCDPIPRLPRLVGYESPMMNYLAYDINTFWKKEEACSEDTVKLPSVLLDGDILLHLQYPNPGYSGLLGSMFLFGYKTSWEHDDAVVKAQIASEGWRLVHTAWHDGGLIVGGKQVSHLLQHPLTLECTVTFQGTKSLEDVLTDLHFTPSSFCSLDEKIHQGFRDHLRRMVKSNDFQKNIHDQLPSCSKVYVTGISLGGVMSELFSACVSNDRWLDLDFDHKYFTWNKGWPRRLSYQPQRLW